METLPLRDIHLPDPIGWWPLAPGWWGLLALLIVLVAGLVYVMRRRRRVTPVQLALAELMRLEADSNMPVREKLQAVSILMKRVAISLYPREEVARLSGKEWQCWLAEKVGGDQSSAGMDLSYMQAHYQPHPPAAIVEQLIKDSRTWLLLIHR